MTRMRCGASKDLGRRAFGTAGGDDAPGETPGRPGEVIDVREEILRRPIVPPAPRMWRPRAGRIYNFPVLRIVEEK